MSYSAKYPFLDTTNDYTPINDMKVVTPDDSNDLPNGPCRALLLTAAGTLRLTTAAGTTLQFTVPTNMLGINYIRASRVLATGTSIAAGNIIACY